MSSLAVIASLWTAFANPSDEVKPWCYWMWQNSWIDEECVVKDLENIKDLGFSGVLLFDTRGYGDKRVKIPSEQFPVYSPEWCRHLKLAIDTADRLGLKFTMNISTSGGTLKGVWPVGEDAPKRLVVGIGDVPVPESFTNYHDIATFELKLRPGTKIKNGWRNAGGVVDRWTRDTGDVFSEVVGWKRINAPSSIGNDTPIANNDPLTTTLRFGYAMIPGRECDVDVIDPAAVRRHLDRLAGPVLKLAGDKVGRTLSHFYSVSWEGAVPTWTPGMEKEFGEVLPALAGFVRPHEDAAAILLRYRRRRNEMFKNNFYGTFRDYCHEHGMQIYSESGGPWNRGESVFRYADQLEFLAINDMPQGESWVLCPSHHEYLRHNRAAAACARLYGKRFASSESFTHMDFHWSIAPCVIKREADAEFADGITKIVWHIYTASPASQGVPGLEYFAGTHINRNVTWNFEAKPIISYLARCQALLSWGKPVMDLALYMGDEVYTHWHGDENAQEAMTGSPVKVPRGYNFDIVNREVMETRAKREGAGLRLPDGAYYRFFADVSAPNPVLPALPRRDVEGPFRSVHRTDGVSDVYFLCGEGDAEVVFDVKAGSRSVEIWNALALTRCAAEWSDTADGRTRVKVSLPVDGSAFVVFNGGDDRVAPKTKSVPASRRFQPLSEPWEVEFAYHPAIKAKPPAKRTWDMLHDCRTGERQLRFFSGTMTCTSHFDYDGELPAEAYLDLGQVHNGVAHVYLNGVDCGLAWCAPWKLDVAGALKCGRNEIVIRITNTWQNRLILDCHLPEAQRVTKSCLHYYTEYKESSWPRRCSGYCRGDERVRSGIDGLVVLETVVDTLRSDK